MKICLLSILSVLVVFQIQSEPLISCGSLTNLIVKVPGRNHASYSFACRVLLKNYKIKDKISVNKIINNIKNSKQDYELEDLEN